MLKNYLKVAFKVLGRNKFYTFISLFGISFTLMVLMLTVAFLQNEMGKNRPFGNKDKVLLVSGLKMQGFEREETITIDSTKLEDGAWKYDTTRTEEILWNQPNNTSNSSVGYKFLKDEIMTLKTPELVCVYSPMQTIDVFPNDQKLSLTTSYTDANYWKIFNYKFLEGSPFPQSSIDNQAYEGILTKSAAENYFGKSDSYLAKTVQWGKKEFKIIGVVDDINTSVPLVKSDIFLPFTHMSKSELDYDWGKFGSMQAVLLGSSPKQLEAIRSDLRFVEDNTQIEEEGFDILEIKDDRPNELYAKYALQSESEKADTYLNLVIFIALFLFILIPTLNLINLNSTRIMERSSEIGVRKAFGANTGNLMSQFMLENIILTGIGGIIGLALTFGAMQWLNTSSWAGKTKLAFNPNIFLYSLIIILIFGICSGLIPAWKMSKMDVAKAIKKNQL